MIEKDILQYIQSDTTITTALGGVGKVYVNQAPLDAQMPWLVIAPGGGTRTKIGPSKTEEVNSVRIYIDAGPNQMVKGRTIAERALVLLENYRGTLGTTGDIVVECSAISSFAGLSGTHRTYFTATVKFVETLHVPPVIPEPED